MTLDIENSIANLQTEILSVLSYDEAFKEADIIYMLEQQRKYKLSTIEWIAVLDMLDCMVDSGTVSLDTFSYTKNI